MDVCYHDELAVGIIDLETNCTRAARNADIAFRIHVGGILTVHEHIKFCVLSRFATIADDAVILAGSILIAYFLLAGSMPFVGGIGSRDAILDEDGTAGAKLHGLHLCARLIYHFLRGIYIVVSIVAHIVCVACRTAKRIALFGGKGEEAVDLKEFREVKAAHLATGLVELQVVLRGRDEGAGRTIHRTLSESLVEVGVEVRVETGNVEVLVELPVEVGSLPEVGTLCLIIDAVEPRLAAGKVVKRLSYA